MDTQSMSQLLMGPETGLGAPAPYWLLVALKVLGFTLHISMMHLWFAGLILALGWRMSRHEYARKLGARLLTQLPLIIALGINFGIVPLLFLQVSYYRAFYPATILMAWPWLAVIALLIVAYYGVYYHVVGLRRGQMTRLHHWAGWLSAACFMLIGFIFSTAANLMTHVERWPELWRQTSVAGAPLGIALPIEPGSVARWAMMLGLAITTVAVWTVLDAGLFAGRESSDYRRWASRVGTPVYLVGLVLYAAAGSLYVFRSWPAELQQTMFSGPHLVLTVLTAVGPGLPLLLVWAAGRRAVSAPVPSALLALFCAIAQFGALGLQAISRQVVQNLKLAPYLVVSADRPNYQWDVLSLFLALFVGGIALIIWMLTRVAAANRREVSKRET